MKKLFLLFFLLLFISCGNKKNARELNFEDEETVYICTGASSIRYHSLQDCRGLERCSGSIEKVSKSYAESIGRTPCKICYWNAINQSYDRDNFLSLIFFEIKVGTQWAHDFRNKQKQKSQILKNKAFAISLWGT